MRLHNITSGKNSTHSRKRLGRGHGSGHGKTSGRGHKGQRSRAGSSQRPGFESGHVPLYRKLPKRGFNKKHFKKVCLIVNVGDLARLDENLNEADRSTLAKAGLVRNDDLPLKVLGDGDIDRALTITANHFSTSAREKIEKAGGKAILIESPAAASQTEEKKEPASEADS